MKSEIISVDDPSWTRVLAFVVHDIYHLPGYTSVSASNERTEGCAYIYESTEGRFLLPLLLRHVPKIEDVPEIDLLDAISPYGYSGPIMTVDSDVDSGEFLRLAIDGLFKALEDRNVVSCFVRSHPVLPIPTMPFSKRGWIIEHGNTISIDLLRSQEEIWHGVRHNHRRDINKATRKGVSVRVDADWNHLQDFIQLYHRTMTRLDASESYFFSAEYFFALRSALGEALFLCIVELDGKVISAGLFSECNGVVQYMLSGTNEEFFMVRPLKSMIFFMQQWSKSRGNRFLHLGGGLGGSEDALLNFKAGFSDVIHPFWTWRAIVNPSAYQELVRAWESSSEAISETPAGFFPAYRKANS